MPTALLLSPHLDDVAFSCGGLAARLSDDGWRVVMATVFTASVLPSTGFALACQLDKGLAPEVDYMALRRAEDLAAAALLGVEARWLDLPEAPHRGYGSAAALFGELRADDRVGDEVAAGIAALIAELSPTLVAAPQGIGGHVDHRQTIDAALSVRPAAELLFYRDTPYVIRDPATAAAAGVPRGPVQAVDIACVLHRKVAASSAYASQITFQFQGSGGLAVALAELAAREGGERFIGELPAIGPQTGHGAATL